MLENLKTVKDMQIIFNVTRKTIYNWRRLGMPSVVIGTSVRFKLSDVNEWIEENKNRSENDDN